MFRITFKKSAQKELANISKPYNQNIVTAIDKLAEDPRPDGVKKLKREDNAYRIGKMLINNSLLLHLLSFKTPRGGVSTLRNIRFANINLFRLGGQ